MAYHLHHVLSAVLLNYSWRHNMTEDFQSFSARAVFF
jgi:hypothetical protein